MMADLGPAQAGEEPFRAVRVDARPVAVERLMVDPLHGEPGLQVIPSGGFVGLDLASLGNASRDE
jgi:hypothetical protein